MKKPSFTDLLVLVPHPDDESALCGGLIVRAVGLGMKVTVAIITTGTNGRTLGLVTRPQLAAARRTEAEKATAALGVKRLHFLGYKDYNPRRQKVHDWTGVQKKLLAAIPPVTEKTLIVSFPPNGLNGHPDHVRCAALAHTLAGKKNTGLLCFTPEKPAAVLADNPGYMKGAERKKLHLKPTHKLRLSQEELEAKLYALSHYRTQALSILDYIRLGNGRLSAEHYALLRGKAPAGLLDRK
ncbi:MAG: PIG-L deacetylase family protein [Alphaproteobacteria bacterium]